VKAFTSGNTDTLRLAVGDQDISHSYIPLAQVTATDVQVAAVGYRKDVKAGDSAPKPTQVVARVTFAIQWQGQDLGTTKTPSRVSYDILLNRADGGAPVVVAWGGVGTGESLTEFMNAENRKITSDGVEKSVASATATAKAPAPAGPTSSPTSVASGDPVPMARWAEAVAVRYRKRRVPMDDVVSLCEGLRRASAAVVTPTAMPAVDAALDASIAVLRWHRRLAGDARKRNPLIDFIYKGA